jgi:hypothetical protein
LWLHTVLIGDTNIYEEHCVSMLSVEICGFRNGFGCVGNYERAVMRCKERGFK